MSLRKVTPGQIAFGTFTLAAALPILAALLASGCNRSDLKQVKDDTATAAQKTKEAAEAAKQAVDTNGKAKDAAADAKDATEKLGSDIADATKHGLDNAAAKTKEVAKDMAHSAKKAADKAKQATPDKDNSKPDH